MNWGSATDFWAMGGYAFYVWGSYGAAVAVIAIELWLLRARRRAAVAALRHETMRSVDAKNL
ncbi:MAG TPA: heme exporter protein CcmD, partial [Burkholderiaceae bacterium]|nr:heme exporter protein CcmD [Burkholderiaceae bacterium]